MPLTAYYCQNDHLTYPQHPRCPTCGEPQINTIDLSDHTGTVITWTTSTAPPPGVRQPNPIAIVEFDTDHGTVRTIGGLTTTDVAIGDTVEPTYVDELRDPNAGIRDPTSQSWDGYRFQPVN